MTVWELDCWFTSACGPGRLLAECRAQPLMIIELSKVEDYKFYGKCSSYAGTQGGTGGWLH